MSILTLALTKSILKYMEHMINCFSFKSLIILAVNVNIIATFNSRVLHFFKAYLRSNIAHLQGQVEVTVRE